MESLWSLNHKTSTYLQGKSMEYFTWNPVVPMKNFTRSFLHENFMGYETEIDRYSAGLL